jgi:exopolysaccharide biosynthesis protein
MKISRIFTKFLLIVLVIFLPFAIIFWFAGHSETTNPEKSMAKEQVLADENSRKDIVTIGNISVAWYGINDPDKLKLLANFNEKKSSNEVSDNYKCEYLGNAGFYSKDSKPLGLFISDGNTLYEYQNNSLFDGILSVNDMSVPRITRDIPDDHLPLALQTGPIVKENGSYQTLKIISDNPARRVMAGVTGDNKLYFITAYQTDSEYIGPNLADLPDIMQEFEEKSGIRLADIINLDGGAASTFNTPNIKLSEFNPVGAFFCQL